VAPSLQVSQLKLCIQSDRRPISRYVDWPVNFNFFTWAAMYYYTHERFLLWNKVIITNSKKKFLVLLTLFFPRLRFIEAEHLVLNPQTASDVLSPYWQHPLRTKQGAGNRPTQYQKEPEYGSSWELANTLKHTVHLPTSKYRWPKSHAPNIKIYLLMVAIQYNSTG
jgi:hypothetical protein